MKKYKVGLVSLGCDKNRIDSEIMLGSMSENYEITNDPIEADIIIVNTCGFIEKAKEESINTILEMAEYKKKHNCKLLIATGCLTQRYGSELLELMPELDIILGVNDYFKMNIYIEQFIKDHKKIAKVDYSDENINQGNRIISTGKATAYLRIAEGCNNCCTYCIIPKIRGKYRSRTKESIVKEAKELADQGIKEVILIAQDTTRYGTDIYGEKKLHELMHDIAEIEGIEWIRVLYCYPEEIYSEMIEEMKNNDKICKYVDLPIQHISNSILRKMARKTTKQDIMDKIKLLRKEIPEIVLRTSLIVGFPGETEENFIELKNFVEEIKLDNLGVFTYSQEEGTPAAKMDNQVEEEVKERRRNEIMQVQHEVAEEINNLKVGNIYNVLIEGYNGREYIGRSFGMAPDVDGTILIKNADKLNVGDFIKVQITDRREYDLIGVVFNEPS
ncbi:30S ribosomal protein S12 methylthiotransferase RimO [Inconstantimicrobium porci]|uniref:Ribosomal protein uS12 methylthiotransferase RimO n=1 Tax=Inconstantimicrobium porci TaxID=2652291 RepID=A0A7X2MW40_9CLOT|nr:30S ribosomal protein S12 methylthiotransferase RimO [Inconstantimicrobium porci]MDD6772073.1 30S ribosomal protein S12 methylthiotransferase RimO [Inconstantimicrobium porci]MSR90171.1 30S ribosomal protein S12 methylthiotransferase RimO [Inconstantimicrobium porci]